MVLKALNLHREKNQPGPKPTPYIKINSKCVGLNIRSKTVKLSEKKKKKQFLDMAPKAWSTPEKNQ